MNRSRTLLPGLIRRSYDCRYQTIFQEKRETVAIYEQSRYHYCDEYNQSLQDPPTENPRLTRCIVRDPSRWVCCPNWREWQRQEYTRSTNWWSRPADNWWYEQMARTYGACETKTICFSQPDYRLCLPILLLTAVFGATYRMLRYRACSAEAHEKNVSRMQHHWRDLSALANPRRGSPKNHLVQIQRAAIARALLNNPKILPPMNQRVI